jgi:hypothetical protein
MPKAEVYSGRISNIKCEGEVIPGAQSIDFKIVKSRRNVHAIGIHERLGIDYGEMYVAGTVRVESAYLKFDQFMGEEKSFQLVLELKKGGAFEEALGTISFDECHIENKNFSIAANGVGISEYGFTATRIRQKMGDVEVDYGNIPRR